MAPNRRRALPPSSADPIIEFDQLRQLVSLVEALAHAAGREHEVPIDERNHEYVAQLLGATLDHARLAHAYCDRLAAELARPR